MYVPAVSKSIAKTCPGTMVPESQMPFALVTVWEVNWLALTHLIGSRR